MLGRTHLTTIIPLDPPAPEPVLIVTVDEVKSQANISTDEDDALITMYIQAAQEQISAITGTVLHPQDMESYFSGVDWTKYGRLPFVQIDRFPLTSKKSDETFKVEYWDGTAYVEADKSLYGIENRNAAFPRVNFQPDAFPIFSYDIFTNQKYLIRVTSSVGYVTPPISLKLAVMQYSTMLYDSRGDCGCSDGTLPGVIMNMVSPFIVRGNFG
jgi:hypothetical protein